MFRKMGLALALSAMAAPAQARDFNIPNGDLSAALNGYMTQSGAVLFVVSVDSDARRSHERGERRSFVG